MPGILTGIAWYQRSEWPLLLSLSTDGDTLERTYDEWRVAAEAMFDQMEERDMAVEKVQVRMAELAAWCAAQGRPLDESARADYVAELLRRREAEAGRSMPPGKPTSQGGGAA
jgi:hypothetical protein